MRVGLFSYDFYPPVGGQGVVLYNLYRHLRDVTGIDVLVFSSRENHLPGHTSLPTVSLPALGPIHFSLLVSRKMGEIAERYDLDLLQVNGGPGGVFLLREPDLPLIYVAHHTYGQQYEYLEKPVYRALMRLEGRGYSYARRIIAVSTTTRDSVISDYGIPGGRITVIPNGVDTTLFRPLDIDKEANSILYVGRLCERKGLFSLLEAIKIAGESIPGIKLYLIGEGELEKRLRRKVVEENLTGNVEFLGRVPEDALVPWYNRASVFVLPSIFEGFGVVCIEAMACGTPVVATRAPGVVDIIEDRENGLLVHGGPRHIADAITELLENKGLRNSLSEEGMRVVRERFDWRNIAESYIDTYNRVIA